VSTPLAGSVAALSYPGPYLALLKLVLPKDYSLHVLDEVRVLAPALLFLASSILFVLGYFSQKGRLSLDLPAEIERERSITIAADSALRSQSSPSSA